GAINRTTVEETGGEVSHALVTAEMPAHNHALTVGGVAAVGSTTSNQTAAGGSFFSASGGVNTIVMANTGSGNAHNNIQPYITVYFWKRTN
ncbi:hypothetical protein FWG95_04785, partial [Candidatus Saccharibacteria bacterium]|nr:hypothetical protein [Candidatus Saccharibacteria bacterium]